LNSSIPRISTARAPRCGPHAKAGKCVRNFETRYVHRDGRAVTLTWMGTWSEPVRRHFFVGRDLTEKQAAEAQFRQAQKMEAVG
jgi:hypothetical protein